MANMFKKKNHRKPDVPANECLEGKNNDLNSIPWTVDITESCEKLNIQTLTFRKLDGFAWIKPAICKKQQYLSI